MIDLSKLTPAPWTVGEHEVYGFRDCGGPYKVQVSLIETDREFTALARNAFDVMMRRGWSTSQLELDFRKPFPDRHGWCVLDDWGEIPRIRRGEEPVITWPDPFTALVEADKWYKEHVEDITT